MTIYPTNSKDFEQMKQKAINKIDNMPAGRALDMLIETEVIGSVALTDSEWEICLGMIQYRDPYIGIPDNRMIKAPSLEPTEMKLSFRLVWPRVFSQSDFGNYSGWLVDLMRHNGWLYDLTDFETTENKIIRVAGFTKNTLREEASAETDAHAICLAALKAVRALKALENTP